jgi:glycosyltransferase involved in cell wall biosynthesis
MTNKNTVKRICLDITNLIPGTGGSGGGIATYALNLIKGLNESKTLNKIEIVCLKHPDFKGLDYCNSITIKNFRLKKNLFSRFFWTHLYLPFYCYKNKIDLLHKVTPELPLIKVCKYVCTLHDLMFHYYLSNPDMKKHLRKGEILKFYFFDKITKHAVHISDTIIVPSAAIKKEVIKKYSIKEYKIVVTHEATEKVENPVESQFPEYEKLKIGVIAGFHPHKGHRKVLELANRFIKAGFINFTIGFRGAAPFENYFNELLSMKTKLGLDEYVSVIPFDPEIKLYQIYASFDVIMLLSEYEGFGLPLLEAQAHNLPVICSDIEVFKEVVAESGYYVGKNFDNDAVIKMIGYLKDKNILNGYALKGKINLKKYSWQKMSNETADIYLDAIG